MPHHQPVVVVTTADQHRFELIHVPCTDARRCLLLLPGMGLSARQYITFARALAERGIEVFIHEWRGVGSSNRRASRRCSWGYLELLDDIDAARAAVVARIDGAFVLAGHSLGAQFACLSAGRSSAVCRALVLIAGGAPYWRVFPGAKRWMMLGVVGLFPLLAAMVGHYPGKRIGFAGREARGVMSDWARSARDGRYEPGGVDQDLEQGMADLTLPVLAVRMADDWFVPAASFDWLLGKLRRCEITTTDVAAASSGELSDHYRWMRRPERTVAIIESWLSGHGSQRSAPDAC